MGEIVTYILGAGGHAKVLLESLIQDPTILVAGFLEVNDQLVGSNLLNFPIYHENILSKLHPKKTLLVNGIGSIETPFARAKQFDRYKKLGFCFHTLKHLTSYVANEVTIGEGAQFMARSTVMIGSKIGDNVIVNTSASVDHDCNIGNHVHIAPGAVLSGNVAVGDYTHIGTGANIIQGIKIGKNVLIAAGAVVVTNISDNIRVAGVPAKKIE